MEILLRIKYYDLIINKEFGEELIAYVLYIKIQYVIWRQSERAQG
jgi:hypothetical protein